MRDGDHLPEDFFPVLLRTDIAREVHNKGFLGSTVQIRNSRDIHPFPLSVSRRRVQIEVWHGLGLQRALQLHTAVMTDLRSQRAHTMEKFRAGLAEGLF